MRTLALNLCGALLTASSVQAQSPPPASEPAPILFIYLAPTGSPTLARIALGVETPVVKVAEFEKCVRISPGNPKLDGIVIQLKPKDARLLNLTIKEKTLSGDEVSPHLVLWYTTPDNKALSYDDLSAGDSTRKLLAQGIIVFANDRETSTIGYLTEKLHPD